MPALSARDQKFEQLRQHIFSMTAQQIAALKPEDKTRYEAVLVKLRDKFDTKYTRAARDSLDRQVSLVDEEQEAPQYSFGRENFYNVKIGDESDGLEWTTGAVLQDKSRDFTAMALALLRRRLRSQAEA